MDEEKNFYLHFGYLLLHATPRALERYVDRNYPGGIYKAVLDNRDDLSDRLSTRQWKEFKRYIETNYNPFGQLRDELLESTILDKEVLDLLISRFHLHVEDRKVVESYARQTDRNKSVIDLMINRGLNVVVLLTKVLKELNEAPDLVRKMETDLHQDTSQQISIAHQTIRGTQRLRIQTCYQKVVNNLGSTETVVGNLITSGTLTLGDAEEILQPSLTLADKNRKLIEKLRSEQACEAFLQAIEKDAIDKKLSEEIRNTNVSDLQTEEKENKEPNQRLHLGLLPILELVSITKRNLKQFYENPNAESLGRSIHHGMTQKVNEGTVAHTGLESSAEHSLHRRNLDKVESLEIEVNRLRNMYCMMVTSECQMTETEYNECRYTIEETLSKLSEKLKDCYGSLSKSELEHLEKEISSEKDKVSKEVLPRNIRVHFDIVNEWKEKDGKFVKTRALTHVLTNIHKKDFLVITGPAGYGKTYQSRHLALRMQRSGYLVVPVTGPYEIQAIFDPRRPILFIIDDMYGNYTANEQHVDTWERFFCSPHYHEMQGCQNKMVATCRLEVFRDECLKKLKTYMGNECNLASEDFCLNREEKSLLIKEYTDLEESDELIDSTTSDCFPLLCSLYKKHHDIPVEKFFTYPTEVYQKELENLYNHGQTGRLKLISLVLCVLYNSKLKTSLIEQIPSGKEAEMLQDVSVICGLIGIATNVQIKESINSLLGTYLVLQDCVYKAIHDKLFDIIASSLAGILGPKIIKCIINYGDSSLIHERCIWERSDVQRPEFYILLPHNLLQSYISKCICDWREGRVVMVFLNINLKCASFRKNMLQQLEEANDKFALANIKDIFVPETEERAGDTPLIRASYEGFTDIVDWLLRNKASVNQIRNNNSVSPLYMASQEGHLDIVRLLLEKNTDVNLCRNDGIGPLFMASQNGHLDIVRLLLEKNADVNLCWNDGVSPLFFASQIGHLDIVRLLLEKNADVNLCRNDGVSPLYMASLNGHLDVVRLLIEMNAGVNLCSNKGESPLIAASQEGHLDTVRLLVKNNADINLCPSEGASSLFMASQNGHVDIVRFLLENNADVNVCLKRNKSSLLHVACDTEHKDVVELLKNKIDINIRMTDGATPLHYACYKGNNDILCSLLENNASVNMCMNIGASPLYLACEYGNLEMVKKLVEKNANVHLCRNDGCSNLLIASYAGQLDIVCFLLSLKVDVNQCSKTGYSPLYWACDQGHKDIVKKLLEAHADVNLCLKNGTSPLDIARRNGHQEIVNILTK